ncbi:MAG: hypothetical protein R3352_04460 [Salinisphaeraceae bacterium]|nr:hypothetical protein [Salinisphaeraceae bacterium]
MLKTILNRTTHVWLFLIALLLLPAAYAEPKPAKLTGFAYERGTDKLLYTENHQVTVDGATLTAHRVDYKTPEGDIISSKVLDYKQHGYAPAFEMTDRRDGYVEGAEYTEQGYRMYSRENADAPMESDTTEISKNLVSDAGFDLYVRARMDSLLAGETEKFRMALAAEQTVLSFQARMLEKKTLFDRPAILIKVEPSTLLRLIVAPIYLTYDTENGELLRYEGLTNIRSETGKRYDARIDFPPNEQQYAGLKRR